MSQAVLETVTIAGVGLIGGSFAIALRKAGYGGKIIGVSSPTPIEALLERGVIDHALPLQHAAAQSDVIYLAQPIERIIETLDDRPPRLARHPHHGRGQHKDADCRASATKRVHRGRFVGGHPMAGKQPRGVADAEAELFHGSPYIFTSRDPELEHWLRRSAPRS